MKGSSRSLGFTLIEILVAVSVIAILFMIGMTSYADVMKRVRDTKRKADIDILAKTYETKYSVLADSYNPVTAEDFSGSSIPKPPEGGQYSGLLIASAKSYTVCAALESHPSRACNTSSETCYCRSSLLNNDETGEAGGEEAVIMPTPATVTVTANEDNHTINIDYWWCKNSNMVRVGMRDEAGSPTVYDAGWKFSLPIPKGSTITSATLSVYTVPLYNWYTTPIKLRVRAEQVLAPASLASGSTVIKKRVYFPAQMNWDIPVNNVDPVTSQGTPYWVDSPNLATLIQNIIDQSGWAATKNSGRDIMLALISPGTDYSFAQLGARECCRATVLNGCSCADNTCNEGGGQPATLTVTYY